MNPRVNELMTEARELAVNITRIQRMPEHEVARFAYGPVAHANRTRLLVLAGEIIAAASADDYAPGASWVRELAGFLRDTGAIRARS